jgi:hypothetical protein
VGDVNETRALLAAVEARATAATPGPWHACGQDRGGCSCGNVWSKAVDDLLLTVNEEGPNGVKFDLNADAAFIAHARADVPALIALAREQMARAEQAERTLADLRAYVRGEELASAAVAAERDAAWDRAAKAEAHERHIVGESMKIVTLWRERAEAAEALLEPVREAARRYPQHASTDEVVRVALATVKRERETEQERGR